MSAEIYIASASVTVAALAIASSLIQVIIREREAKNRVRYGIVYQEQFRVSKELYTRMSRLKDAIVMLRDPRTFGNDKNDWLIKLGNTASALRRSIKQNDVMFPVELGDHLNGLWQDIKDSLDDIEDGMTDTPEDFRKSCTNAIKLIDDARKHLAPYFRTNFGIEQSEITQ